jgi:hypothetical protein
VIRYRTKAHRPRAKDLPESVSPLELGIRRGAMRVSAQSPSTYWLTYSAFDERKVFRALPSGDLGRVPPGMAGKTLKNYKDEGMSHSRIAVALLAAVGGLVIAFMGLSVVLFIFGPYLIDWINGR